MDDAFLHDLFNCTSVISGRCVDDNERLCAMKPRLWLIRFQAWLELGAARSVGQRLTH